MFVFGTTNWLVLALLVSVVAIISATTFWILVRVFVINDLVGRMEVIEQRANTEIRPEQV